MTDNDKKRIKIKLPPVSYDIVKLAATLTGASVKSFAAQAVMNAALQVTAEIENRSFGSQLDGDIHLTEEEAEALLTLVESLENHGADDDEEVEEAVAEDFEEETEEEKEEEKEDKDEDEDEEEEDDEEEEEDDDEKAAEKDVADDEKTLAAEPCPVCAKAEEEKAEEEVRAKAQEPEAAAEPAVEPQPEEKPQATASAKPKARRSRKHR